MLVYTPQTRNPQDRSHHILRGTKAIHTPIHHSMIPAGSIQVARRFAWVTSTISVCSQQTRTTDRLALTRSAEATTDLAGSNGTATFLVETLVIVGWNKLGAVLVLTSQMPFCCRNCAELVPAYW